MTATALITGASSGIGAAFARYHAAIGGDLVLVARREDALEQLKTELEAKHGIKVHVFARDVGSGEAAQALYDEVTKAGIEVGILINNAGFGGRGNHIERELASEQAMVDLNIMSLMTLTRLFGHDMAQRGKGYILNVGSTAGFMPGPSQAVYFATKAFVNSYSQALNEELKPRGVKVTVLAPGYVETAGSRRSCRGNRWWSATSGPGRPERQILGHVTGFHRVDADLLQRVGELGQFVVAVELGAVGKARVQAKIEAIELVEVSFALLVLAVVAGDGAVGGFGFHRLAVRGHQHRGHQAERAEALGDVSDWTSPS
jgi:short-subunit dehydrogenase